MVLLLAVSAGAGDVETLNVGFYIEPTSYDPHVVTSTDVFVAWNIYEPLVDFRRDTVQLEGKLATSWEVSADQKLYTFKLRRGVKFHDGTPFTAAAVKTSIERIQHFKRGVSWLLTAVKEVKVVDDYTVQVVLTKPDIAFQQGLPFIYVVSPTAVKARESAPGDLAGTWFSDHSAGTGPYKIESWGRGSRLVLTKFDDYWRGWKGQHVSKVVYHSVLESGTQRLMVEKGDMDIPLVANADDIAAYRKNANVVVDTKPGTELMYIRMHNQAGPTKDKRVRQALSLAFDWKTYETVMRGNTSPSDGPAPKELLDGWKPEGVMREYNPDRAKKLLAEAGHPNGFKLAYLYNKGDEEKRVMGEVWQAGLQKIGVALEIKVMTWPTLVERLSSWGDNRSEAAAEGSYGQYTNARIADAYAFLYFMYHSTASKGSGRNFMYYSNPKVDDLIARAASVTPQERLKLYREASQLIVDDVPDIFVNKLPDNSVRRKVVQGHYFDPLSSRAYHFYDLYKTGP
jgi:peptide/nickel transport system substrate-binding protein